MQLKDFVIPRSEIALPGPKVDGKKPSFFVRGITLDDMTFLVGQHLGPITRALKLYQESREDVLAKGNLQGFIMTLARDFPDLVAEVISAANDSLDDETRKVVRKLPLSTQIIALTEIVRLTLEDAGGLKNLLAEMQATLQGAAASVESEDAPLARPEVN
jgi:hypothetical protein